MFDTSLIFSLVNGLQVSTHDSVDIITLLLYELAPVPTYMFSESSDLKLNLN